MSAISVHRLTNRPLLQRLLLFSLLGAYTILLVRTAWMCDDAFITLRTVDNFVQGYGLVWNVGERVQVYTHPLWMFLLSTFYAFTREPYFTTLAISMALSLATVVLLLWTGRHHLFTLLLVGIISIGSKAFADYSTSGLENPLAHLLLVAFFVLCLRRPPHPSDVLPLGTLAGLTMLNRLDHGVLVIPALFAAAVQLPRRAAVTLLTIAGAPVAGWLLFSLVYYGFPFPNTFYAKQTTGIPRIEYLERGVGYLIDTAVVDSVTLSGIVLAVGLALWRRRPLMLLAAAAGVVLYVLYVIWIGGDFMGGRMFSAPLVTSATLLAVVNWGQKRLYMLLIIFLTSGLVAINRPYLIDREPSRGSLDNLGHIVDERLFYKELWLLPTLQGKSKPEQHPWVNAGIQWRKRGGYFHARGSIGMFGYYAGQQTYILDELALSDAFLARIGPRSLPGGWRIGHVPRPIPEGYLVTRFMGENKITEPRLRTFYEKINVITTYPIFSIDRWKAVLDINTTYLPFSIVDDFVYERYFRFINFDGVPVGTKDINIILGANSFGRRLFFRAEGSYEVKIMSDRGHKVIQRQIFTLKDKERDIQYLDLANGADFIQISPLDNISSTVCLVLPSPPPYINPEIVSTDFVVTNLRIPFVFNYTDSKLESELLWLKTHKRSLLMFLKAVTKTDHVLEVRAIPVCPPSGNQIVRLWLNGQQLAEHFWTDCSQPWEAQLLIPAEQLLKGWNLLEAEAEHGVVPATVFPGNNDRRTLFVGFQRLWSRPAQ